MKIDISPSEARALLSILHGAQDDDDGDDKDYTKALASVQSKIRSARIAKSESD